jgi:hypothetical protein
MHIKLVLSLTVVCGSALLAQPPKQTLPVKRYGIESDVDKYPQATPKDTLASVLKAIEYRKVDYVLAQLADPEYVDRRVKQVHAGKFDGMVEETTAKLANDPGVIKKLRRFLNEGTWDTQETTASASLPDAPERVHLRKIDARWFFENQDRPKSDAKEKGQ